MSVMEEEQVNGSFEIKSSWISLLIDVASSILVISAFLFVVILGFISWIHEKKTWTIFWGGAGLFGLGGLAAWLIFTYFPRKNTRISFDGNVLKVGYSFWGKRQMDLTQLKLVKPASADLWFVISYSYLKLIDKNNKKLYLWLGCKDMSSTGIPLEKLVQMYKLVAPYLFNPVVDCERAKSIAYTWYPEKIREKYGISLPM